MAEGWLIVGVRYFELSLGNHQSDEYFCPSTLGLCAKYLLSPTANWAGPVNNPRALRITPGPCRGCPSIPNTAEPSQMLSFPFRRQGPAVKLQD